MKEIRLYNTLTRQQEIFQPRVPGQVGLYVCGPTVYDRAHLGNARPVLVFDVLYRLLSLDYHVTYVRNITDIDDKIIQASQARGIPIETVTRETTRLFHEDMASLRALSPTHEPRATDHVPDMIQLIETLLDKGHAYEAEGHVLFKVHSYPGYGALSRARQEDVLAGARVEVAPYKKDPSDFILWKPSKDLEPGWQSPWGRGRPGWHIECSAMSATYLGPTFDLHGGGQDLIFPHHENEVAQSCAAHGTKTFATYWIHNGILTVHGEKMSKSLGNFVTVEALLQKAKGETIRAGVLMTHYRQPLDWTDQSLLQAKASLDRLYTALEGFDGAFSKADIDAAFLESLCQDLNTPGAWTRLHALAKEIHKERDPSQKISLQKTLKASGNVMGLLQEQTESWFQQNEGTSPALGPNHLSEQEIETLIQDRLAARQRKDFQHADALRDHLMAQGILLEDTAEGTKWKRS